MASMQPLEFRLIKRPVESQAWAAATTKKKPRLKAGDFKLRELTFSSSTQTNDEVHQSIELCPVMKALVDTKAFQRLRHVRQLGTSEFLYDCATGNRFQHSLGVAFLAEKMCKTIKEEQPNLGTTEKDVLCVKLAGLLHDIGHGPYSHLSESFREGVLPNFLKDNPDLEAAYDDCKHLQVEEDWSHEQSSLQMIDAALAELGLEIDHRNLDRPLKQIGDGVDSSTMRVFKPPGLDDSVTTSRDWIFIKECVLGKPLPGLNDFIGRTEAKKEWLYDIVNNRHSGLDVDKIDYFARDSRSAFGPEPIEYKMVEDARVARAKCSRDECERCAGEHGYHLIICYPDKRVPSAMKFFRKRLDLHEAVYQNKKTVAAELLLYDIMCSADPFFRLKSSGGESFPPSRAVIKSDFLLELDDSYIHMIGQSTDPRLAEARALYQRLRRHDMYKCAVDERLVVDDAERAGEEFERDQRVAAMSDHAIHSGMLLEKKFWEGETGSPFPLEAKDFIVRKYHMHYGRKSRNPVLSMRFFDKDNGKLLGPLEDLPVASTYKHQKYSHITPRSFQTVGVRVYCREASKRDLVNQVFLQWYERMLHGEAGEAEITPGSPCVLKPLENEDEDSEDEGDEDDNDGFRPALLSQESLDADDEECSSSEHEPSPIPIHRHRRRRP